MDIGWYVKSTLSFYVRMQCTNRLVTRMSFMEDCVVLSHTMVLTGPWEEPTI